MRTAAILAVLAVFASACGAAPASADTVSVVGIWTGPEAVAFEHVLDQFTADTGIHYAYTGTRAIDQVLQADVRDGSTPDVAVVASPGQLITYYQNGQLSALDGLSTSPGDYGPQWRSITRASLKSGPRHQFAVVVKADLKSIVWYSPSALEAKIGPVTAPTWQQLSTQWPAELGGTPWCIGLGADAESGFPGTDWIEEILLHTYGPTVYAQWADGVLHWNSQPVITAFQTWQTLLNEVPGHATAALLTRFDRAGTGMFTNPPRCYLDSEGSFIDSTYGNHPAAYFPFPAIDPRTATDYEVSANLAGMFTNRPAARQLIEWLARRDAQALWPKMAGSFSVDQHVPMTVYPDPVRRSIATRLADSGATLCFDASDLMPSQMSAAFEQAVQAFAADPTRLPSLLDQLDLERASVYSGGPMSFQCGQ